MPEDGARAKELVLQAAEHGINLVWAGFGAEAGERSARLLESAGVREKCSLILGLSRADTADIGSFITRSGAGRNDILLMEIPDAAFASNVRESGLVGTLAELRRDGKICGFGFSTPADTATVQAALEASDEWDCWSMYYNYTRGDLAGIISQAGQAGLGFLALDPFAGGSLEKVPAAVHELYRNAPVPRSHDEWALRALWDCQDLTSVVLAPQSDTALTRAAILAEAGRPNSLLNRELDVLREAAGLLNT